MSHIEEGKTSLVFADLPALLQQRDAAIDSHPCLRLLREALALVATQYGGEVRTVYYDYYYDEQPVNTQLALHIPVRPDRPAGHALPRGIGLMINGQTGALSFVGDPWRVDRDFYHGVQRAIVQKYTVLAHMAALKQMRYIVSTQENSEGQVSVTGVSYA